MGTGNWDWTDVCQNGENEGVGVWLFDCICAPLGQHGMAITVGVQAFCGGAIPALCQLVFAL